MIKTNDIVPDLLTDLAKNHHLAGQGAEKIAARRHRNGSCRNEATAGSDERVWQAVQSDLPPLPRRVVGNLIYGL
jgi:hypothetical protein